MPKSAMSARVAVFVVIFFVFTACSRKNDETSDRSRQKQPVAVAVVRVAVADLNNEMNLTGDLKPFQEVEVMAKVAGYVRGIHVDIGDRVRKGQLLAELEVPELGEDLTQAKAALRRTDAEAERARSELHRAQSAYGIAKLSYSRLSAVAKQRPGLVAQQELDDVKSKELAAEAQVAAAQSGLDAATQEISVNQAALARIKTMFDYARVTAPFDGVVTKRYADTGSMIQAGTTSQTQAMPLVRLSQTSMLRLIVPVPEPEVPTIHVGQQVEVNVPTVKRTFAGKVARFADQVAESTRTMNTEIDVANQGQSLVPGMYAEVKLSLGQRKGALTVPVGAVDVAGGEDSGKAANPSEVAAVGHPGRVMVLTPDNRIRIQQVTVGLETASKLEILSGLKAGDLVVIGSRASLQAGQEVRPKVTALGGI
jgi:RND family efflux transporter MFP subunit